MKFEINVDRYDIINNLCQESSNEELEKFVTELDLMVGDVGFTENIIGILVNSMAKEYSKSDDPNDKSRMKHWTSILNTIKQIKEIPDWCAS